MPPFFCSSDGRAAAIVRYIAKLTALIMTVCCFASCRAESVPDNRVIHGGGVLWEVDSGGIYRAFAGSNSREALMRCADEGVSFAELDFSFTSDDVLVCIHGWSREYISGIEENAPLTLEEFRQSRIYGCFTPMTLADAAEILRSNEDLTIVADIKDDFQRGAAAVAGECADLLDRIVIQIYSPEQYAAAAELGFERIAYTLYRLPWDEKLDADAHIAFARECRLEWIAFSYELLGNADFTEKMLASGVPLYVHTVNDEKTVKYLLDTGFAGVYTDNIN